MNNTNTNTNNTNNVLPGLKAPNVVYPIFGMIILMMIVVLTVLVKVKMPFTKMNKSKEEMVSDIFIILFFIMLIVGICITLLPNFKEVKTLFQQISSVTYIIIYTIFLILFLTLTPSDTINNYAYIIMPITIAIGSILFYKGSTQNYLDNFNVNYERIKTMIMFLCLIAIFIIYYITDPGGYINKYFGYTMLLTIIMAIFGFLYLMIILTLPDKIKEVSPGAKSSNFLENFSGFSLFGSIGLLLFIVAIAIAIAKYPGGIFNDKPNTAFAMIMILMIFIFATLLGTNLLPDFSDNSNVNNKLNLFKRSLLVLFNVVISSLIIFWIVYNIQNLSGKSGVVSLILNLLIVTIILGLIYKTINVKLPSGNSNKNAFFSLITNTLLYIPCLFSGLFDHIGKSTIGDNNSDTSGSLIMLITSILLLVSYFKLPAIFNLINVQGGNQLVNQPVYTATKYSLGSYQELNGSDNVDYQYAISSWIFLDASPPNTSASYNNFTSLLNFANKPNVLYNGTTNTLMITTDQKNLKEVTKNKLIDFDENGNRIIYKNSNFLLQKWNNIIINYNGGVLDIFLNGELVKSDIGVVPYMTYDNLTIGEDNGIKGGICNVVYFKQALNTSKIFYLYNMVKDRSPPVINDSNTTIVKQTI